MSQNFILLDGKKISLYHQEILKAKLLKCADKLGLAVILLGDDPSSHIYVKAKISACSNLGIDTYPFFLCNDSPEEELLDMIDNLNNNQSIHGILIQLPLPKHINQNVVLERIHPHKDVDCFHPINLGKLFAGISEFAPATPAGIMMLINSIKDQWSLESKNALVIGTSNIVGKPLSIILMHRGATVTMAHIKTHNLKELCLSSDLIISAVGKPHLITSEMVPADVVLVDVGMNRIKNNSIQGYKLVGDVDFNQVKDRCFAITPVPGGVGPMTVLALMYNLYYLYQKYNR